MTINIALASAGDGYIESRGAAYQDALDGTGGLVSVGSGGPSVQWGQVYLGDGFFYVQESYHSFTYSADATKVVTSAWIRVRALSANNTGISRYLTFQEYDWGASLDAGDWRPSTWWSTVAELGNIADAQAAGTMYAQGGSAVLATRLASAGPLRVVGRSDRTAAGVISGQGVGEVGLYAAAAASGTADDPALIWITTPLSTHTRVAGAQVRMTDGAWCYLESDGAATPGVTLKRRTAAGAVTTIATLPIGTSSTDFAVVPGMQGLALVRDASDNLYVIGARGSNTGSLAARCYVKGAGTTWTASTLLAGSLPQYLDSSINRVAGGWHSAGTNGTIMVLVGHTSGRWNLSWENDETYALLNCNNLISGSGSLLRNSGTMIDYLIAATSSATYYTTPANETGSGSDVQVPPSGSTRGYLVSWDGRTQPGATGRATVTRYTLASNGASITSVAKRETGPYSFKDGQGKIRLLAINDTTWATVSIDATTGVGPAVAVYQNVGTSGTVSEIGYVVLGSAGITSLPAAAILAASGAWDAVYDTAENRVWIYYVDQANARRVVRTSVRLDTYLAVRDEVQVTASLGTGAASVCRALRVERNTRAGDSSVLVSAAVDTSGVLTTDYYADSFNQAPTAPPLSLIANFDATASKALSWTFTDPNAGDTQSAFEVDINTAAGVDTYGTGKMGAPVAYVAAGTGATGNNASLNPGMPAGWAQGDLLLLFASIRNSGTGTVDTPSGWTSLVASGNAAIFGRIARATDAAPTVTFTGGAAGADTLAQIAALRGTDQDITTVAHASQAQLNGSAQNIAYPALTVTTPGCAIVYAGWKQDDWTSVATIAGATEISDSVFSTAGSDAGEVWDYVIQTTAANISGGSFAVTGGASAISRGITLALRPYQAPTTASFTLPANTLTNAASWQWRVRTYDAAGLVSPWSDYGTFQTSASGTVTITDPASDNPAGVVTDDYAVAWSVAGTTQADYRVVVIRTDTSAALLDTGWVASTATTYTVAGMLSGVTYQVSVTVRNASAVESGAGLRLITPAYGDPETPTVIVTPVNASGYTLVTTTNPPPGTPDIGTTVWTMESGVTGLTATGGAVTQSSAQAYAGTYSAALTVSGSPSSATLRPSTPGNAVAVTVGQRYTLSYRAYTSGGYADTADVIQWLDGSYAPVASSSQTVSLPAAAWTARSYTAQAPVGAVYATYGPSLLSSPANGTVLYTDNLLFAVASDRPTPLGNAVYRRRADGTGDTVEIAAYTAVTVDGTVRDHTAASGVAYEYRAHAVASSGTADSAWTSGTLTLQGVWIHDPLDAQGTVRQYPYGRSARSGSLDVDSKALQFVGRIYPVVEFGEQGSQTFSVPVLIPFGPTWAADCAALEDFATARRTLVFRDNRGRAVYCSLSGLRITDNDQGTLMTFMITRVDYAETTV